MITANSVSGTGDYGIASAAIANVAATDLVNGAPAVLGAGGNATVAKGSNWPASFLGLNPATGAVSTFVSTPVGTYTFQYQLCDLNTPPDCAVGPGTVTVSQASITAAVQTGSADQGIASTAIV